jgi:hypothetical protein
MRAGGTAVLLIGLSALAGAAAQDRGLPDLTGQVELARQAERSVRAASLEIEREEARRRAPFDLRWGAR